MGTETRTNRGMESHQENRRVKLNNPLMGTET